jgi:hypothetical protein
MPHNVQWFVEELAKKHARTAFDCGEPALNDYLKKFALQNAKNNVSKTFVVVSPDTSENILGFYSLSAANINVESLPLDIQKKLPRYPIPMARLTRVEQEKLQNELITYEIIWPSQETCNEALNIFTQYFLNHNIGLLDVLIGQTAVELGVPLYTFNQKHYKVIPHLKTIQPYEKKAYHPLTTQQQT